MLNFKQNLSTKLILLFSISILFDLKAQNGVGVNTNTPKSSFEVSGSVGKKVTVTTIGITLDETNGTVVCNNSSAIAITLPTASTCAARVYEIKRTAGSTANVTVTATIDGVINYVLTQAGQSVTVFSDGTNWLKRDGGGDASNWSITGNTGTIAGTNFLGTTDAIDFVLKTSGTERMRALSTGNIGINETSPSTKLHVTLSSASASTMPLIVQNNGGGANPAGTEVVLRLSPSSSPTLRGADISALNNGLNDIDMKFSTGSGAAPTEKVRIMGLGNVGINTSAPTSKLHVIANDAKTTNYAGTFLSNTATSSTSSIYKKGLEITSTGTWNGTTAANIGLHVSSVTGGTSNYDAIFNGGGYVGINNIKPRERLHVSGNIQLGDSMATVATGNRLEFSQFYNNSDPVAIYRVNTAYDNSVLRFELGDNGAGTGAGEDYFDFCAFNTTAAPAVRISTSIGNMGINVLNPTSRLHVVASGTNLITDYAGTFLSNTATSTQLNVDKKGLEITSTGTWTGTNSTNIGLHVSSVTGGTVNYDAIFNGGGFVGIGTATPTERLHIYNGTAPYVLLESTGGAGKILGYKIRPWSGMAANTYAGFGGVDDALSSVRAAIYVPNAANTGVMEAVSILKSSGNVGINTTAPTSLLSVNGTADKAGGGTWGTFSDKRLKKDILDYNDGLSALLQIHPVKFKYNGKGPYKDTTSEYIGVIAQEIKKVAPYTVETFSMKLDQNDKSETTLLKYDGSSLTYMLINSVKELKAQIDVLKAENAIQKEELKSIQTLQYEISEIKKLLSTEASAAKNSK